MLIRDHLITDRMLLTAFSVTLACIVAVSLWPKSFPMPAGLKGKAQHMAAFAVLASLASHAFWRASPLNIGMALAAVGALIEVAQLWQVAERQASLMDWLAGCSASAVVLLVSHFRD